MEVGLTIGMDIQEGTLKLHLMDSGCIMKDMIIQLHGGASWLYQGYEYYVERTICLLCT